MGRDLFVPGGRRVAATVMGYATNCGASELERIQITYGPEARHFKAQIPAIAEEIASPDRGAEALRVEDNSDAAIHRPKSQWGAVWHTARSLVAVKKPRKTY